MRDTLKHYFIPHEGNAYHPHFLRNELMVVVLCVATILFATSLGSVFVMRKTHTGAVLGHQLLIGKINDLRKDAGLLPLSENKALTDAAYAKAQDMHQGQYVGHSDTGGRSLTSTLAGAGYQFLYAGEYVTTGSQGDLSAGDVIKALAQSPYDSRYTDIGVASYDGSYQGVPTTFTALYVARQPQYGLGAVTQTATAYSAGISYQVVPVIAQHSDTFETVKNIGVSDEVATDYSVAPGQSVTLGQKLLAAEPHTVQVVYWVLMALVFVGLIGMIVFQFRGAKLRNIIMAMLFLAMLIALAYLNKTFLM